MGKEKIEYRCGHSEIVDLCGKHDRRDAIVASRAKELCPGCRANAATKQDVAAGLPKLTGSAKQISWASEIRTAKLAELQKIADQLPAVVADATKQARLDATKQACMDLREVYETETRSSRWIDERENEVREEINDRAKKIYNAGK